MVSRMGDKDIEEDTVVRPACVKDIDTSRNDCSFAYIYYGHSLKDVVLLGRRTLKRWAYN